MTATPFRYYYEQKIFSGKWAPRCSVNMPTSRSADGGKSIIRNIQQIKPQDQLLTIDQLQEIYGETAAPEKEVIAETKQPRIEEAEVQETNSKVETTQQQRPPVTFLYTNHRNNTEQRTVTVDHFWFGNNSYYPGGDFWFMRGLCHSRGELRDFMLQRCNFRDTIGLENIIDHDGNTTVGDKVDGQS